MRKGLTSVITAAAFGMSIVPVAASGAGASAGAGAQAARRGAEIAATAAGPAGYLTDGGTAPVTLTLPTGEQITVAGPAGAERVVRRRSGVPNVPLLTRRDAGHTYVLPVTAEPYLARQLDPEAFDVTALAAAQRTGTAKSSSVPGFGAGLLNRWARDRKAGHYTSEPLAGAENLRVTARSAPKAKAAAATYPLVVSVTGVNGQPLSAGSVHVVNMDDGRTYNEYVKVASGEVRVSVPKGTYAVVGADSTYTPDEAITWTSYQGWVLDVKVGTSGGTATLDYTRATIDPTPATPRPAVMAQYGLSYAVIDARGRYVTSLGGNYDSDLGQRVLLSPVKAATVGRLEISQLWGLKQAASVPSYAYWLSAYATSQPADPAYRFTTAQLAPVKTAFYGDGAEAGDPTAVGGLGRSPDFTPAGAIGSGTGVRLDEVPNGTRRVDYIGALAEKQPRWENWAMPAARHRPDDGGVSQQLRYYTPGLRVTENWFKGPWASGILTQSAAQEPFCYACREGDLLHFRVRGFTDADRHHGGLFTRSTDKTQPVARIRLYQGKTLLSEEPDWLYTYAFGPEKSAAYRVLVDFDRRQTGPVLSTKSTTEYTFRSARNTGRLIDRGWACDIDVTGDPCRVLPVVQASLDLPVSLNGSLPASASTVGLTVGRLQQAGAVAITSGRLEVRRSGTSAWTTVGLQTLWGGRFKGTVDNSAWAGQFVDVRYGGTDAEGSTFLQTVTRAYRVE